MPNLLATKTGRLTAFFLLYMTEGIPQGFTSVALAAQMRINGASVAEVGLFVGSLYWPWAFKWAVAPLVDVFYSDRFGRRRLWIVGCQCAMIVTLLATMPLDLQSELWLLGGIMLVHNVFAATQDVAIDALACSVLNESERGLANGLMFAGSYIGSGVGGAGALFLTPYIGFQGTFLYVAGALGAITILVSMWIKEPPTERPKIETAAGPLSTALGEARNYLTLALRAMVANRPARMGLLFALLPPGAYALSLALQTSLAVDLGFDDTQRGLLNTWSTVLAATGCVLGGVLSDYFGRRRMVGIYIGLTTLPTIALAIIMYQQGWTTPPERKSEVLAADAAAAPSDSKTQPVAAETSTSSPESTSEVDVPGKTTIVHAFWVASLVYAFIQGLVSGGSIALFMDLSNRAVVATHFTAFMSVLNLVISYSSFWQGLAVDAWGYAATLVIDASVGLVCLGVLPWTRPQQGANDSSVESQTELAREVDD